MNSNDWEATSSTIRSLSVLPDILPRMADAGATDSGLVITAALFGGAGAFLGAVLGQVIGWVREERAEKRVDRRRDEDRKDAIAREGREREEAAARERRQRRHDNYVSTLSFLLELRRAASTWKFMADLLQNFPEDPKHREMVEVQIEKVGEIIKSGFDDAIARVEAVGSEEVVEMFRAFQYRTPTFYTSNKLGNVLNRLRDGAEEELARRRDDGEEPWAYEYLEEYEIPWREVAGHALGHASGFLADVEALVRAIRKELDLSA